MADQNIEEILQKMPEIEPSATKEELYRRISSQVDHPPKKKLKKFVAIPALSTVFVILMVMFVFTNNGQYSVLYDQELNNANKEFSSMEESMSQDSAGIQESQLKRADENVTNQLILQQTGSDENVLYGEVTNKITNTVIPVSYLLPQEKTNARDKKQILRFEDKLSQIFNPNKYQTEVFEDKTRGSIASVEKVSYKLYKNDDIKKEFLIPVKVEGVISFEDALRVMKENGIEKSIISTIPANITFTVSESDDIVKLTIRDNEENINKNQYQIMIEAILMTAKSYGYHAVKFNNIELVQIGPYYLAEPVRVPIAVNPIHNLQ